jgi:hypothetical protein
VIAAIAGCRTTLKKGSCPKRPSRGVSVLLTLLLALAITPTATATAAPGDASVDASTTSGTGAPRAVEDSCPEGSFPEAGFVDVRADNVHENTIDCLVWWRVANGRNSAYYAPTSGVSREAMASFIARAVNIDLTQPAQDAFNDDDHSVHQPAINHLAQLGVVGGTGEGRYSPTRVVSRAQMARFMAKAAEYVLGTPLSADQDYFDDDAGHLFELDINKSAEAGIAGGRSGRVYEPDAPVNRDQMASFLARLLDVAVEGQVRQSPQPESVPRDPGDDMNCEDFASRGDAQARYNHYLPHYGDNARLDLEADRHACDGPTACPEQLPGQVPDEVAARCLYEAWTSHEMSLAGRYASQDAVAWFDGYTYDGYAWQWDGCDAAMVEEGGRSCYWYIPDPDPNFHGVVIEMFLGFDEHGHFVSLVESYG